MATASAKVVTFVVPSDDGKPMRADEGAPAELLRALGDVQGAAAVSAVRGETREQSLDAVVGEDVVVLQIQGGPSLVLHPETARELLLAQQGIARASRAGAADGGAAPGAVRVPRRLAWRGHEAAGLAPPAQRGGFVSDVLISGIHIVKRPFMKWAGGKIAAGVIANFDGKIDAGLHRLAADRFPGLKSADTRVDEATLRDPAQPLLVLLHGTFSSTAGSFGKLWDEHPALVRELFGHYANDVYALEHPTLGASPIANALALAKALPAGTRLHLLTHSRGGLVAEVLARACSGIGLSEQDLKPFTAAGHGAELHDLQDLLALARARGLRVERVVRVACPARGTLLASKRLDVYLSVLKWTLELAKIPVADALVELLAEVAKHRTNPEEAPGLAEQMPGSPLVKWLHAVDDPIPGELRVVAGEMQGDSLVSWLKTLLSDAFYWTDNDLIVQTRSMYGGAPRGHGASFLLDCGGDVSHFAYFSNAATALPIVKAVTDDGPPLDFRPIGPLSWSGQASEGWRAARREARADDAARPAVFLLPGILGSHLKVDGRRIWLSWRIVNGLEKLRYTGKEPDGVTPDAPIGATYDALTEHLSNTHEVIEFPFDWRRPIESEAARLAARIEAALNARVPTGQPVRIVAHSMGGLLARAVQLEKPELFERLLANPGARILLLGTPHGGSWAPMQVLTGDDTFGNTLVTIGSPFDGALARQMMAELPGFMQLQAGLFDEGAPLSEVRTWQDLAAGDAAALAESNGWHTCPEQADVFKWGIPSEAALRAAAQWRKRLDQQLKQLPALFKDRLVQVVGEAKLTPCGYENGSRGLTYLHVEAADGDGRVTLDSALLPNVPAWQVPYAHGDLPKAEDFFDLYVDLLQTGTTSRLPGLSPQPARGARAARAALRLRPSRAPLASVPPRSESDTQRIPGVEEISAGAAGQPALPVTVVNGNLTFVHEPLLMGHYRGAALTGGEHDIDVLIGGTMTASLRVGRYPQQLETQQVFLNTGANRISESQRLRPAAVIIVGLGEEGQLRGGALSAAVRQGVIAWSQRLAEQPAPGSDRFELASTLIGSGGINMSAGEAARLVVEGVHQANQRLAASNWPLVGRLRIVELYLDRATEAWRSLQMLSMAEPGRYRVKDVIDFSVGAQRRPIESGYRGVGYDLITAVSQENRLGEPSIAYTLDTRRARTEVRAMATQGRLLRELVTAASNDTNKDKQIGRTLFQLLIPFEMRPFLAGSTEMQIELDAGTAGIPWELLDSGGSDAHPGDDQRPWAIRSKLLRKLRTDDFRRQIVDAEREAHVLVIGEPNCDAQRYPRLPGARAEAEAVAGLFRAGLGDERVRALHGASPSERGPNAREVINALLARDWRIVHIAGHGEAPGRHGPSPKGDDGLRGVVLSNDTYLGPREIRNMERVPELVFINCCHSAERGAEQLLAVPSRERFDRPQFAATVADELIKIGVRCVVAAGWAVDDEGARVFATTFYRAVIDGHRFIEAVALAREAAWRFDTNTWAAYQCYGDAEWRLDWHAEPVTPRAVTLGERYANVASPPALTLALEALATKSRYEKTDPQEHSQRIRYLEHKFRDCYGGIGAIAESFGLAWAEAGELRNAIEWYEAALAANDGSSTFHAAEQHVNLSAMLAWSTLRDEIADLGAKSPERAAAIARAREQVGDALARIDALLKLAHTVERLSICGSACKRLAMIEGAAGRRAEEDDALEKMALYYREAVERAQSAKSGSFFYPALNQFAAELALRMRGQALPLDAELCSRIRESLKGKNRDDADFWSVTAELELELYQHIDRRALADHAQPLEQAYRNLHERVPSVRYWRSVYDQCEFVLSNYGRHWAKDGREGQAADQLMARLGEWIAPHAQAAPRG
jgi:hypothetical protein